MENNNLKSKEKMWAVIIIAIIFGFLAGFLAQTVSSLYFLSNYGLPITEDGLAGFISKKERASRLGQFFDYQATNELSQSLVGIYLKKQGGQDVLSQIYLPSELKGQGIILTSDGWILTAEEVVKGLTSGRLVIIFEQKSYEVDELLIDNVSGSAFVHIVKNTDRNWPVASISRYSDLQTGQAVLAVNSNQEIVPSNVSNLYYSPLATANSYIKSADTFSTNILIRDELNEGYLGAPIINLAGEVVGLISQTKAGQGTIVIPASHFDNIIETVLKDNKIRRAYLGVNYIDLAQVSGVSKIGDLGEHQLRRGALLYGSPAVAYGSPAAKVGLIKDDIILKVDDEQVNHQKNLTDLIQDFKPGDIVKLLILRDGLDKEVEVALGEQ